MTTGIHQARLDGFGGFPSKHNTDKHTSLSHSIQNGCNKWAPNIWGDYDKSDTTTERGSGSLVPSSEVDTWTSKRPTSDFDPSSLKRGSALPPVQQAHAGQLMRPEREQTTLHGSAFTSAGQSIGRQSSVDWQNKPTNQSLSLMQNGHGIKHNTKGLGPLGDGFFSASNPNQGGTSWAEDEGLFSPTDQRHSLSGESQQTPGALQCYKGSQGSSQNSFKSLRGSDGFGPSPWQSNGHDRSSEPHLPQFISNGSTLPATYGSKSASAASGNGHHESTLTNSFGKLSLSGSEPYQNAGRRHNLAYEGPYGPRSNGTHIDRQHSSHDTGSFNSQNLLENSRLNGGAYHQNSLMRPGGSFEDHFDAVQSFRPGESDFCPTFNNTNMGRTASSESHSSAGQSSRRNELVSYAGHGSVSPFSYANGHHPVPDRELLRLHRQEQQYLQHQWQQMLAAQVRGNYHNPYGFGMPFVDMQMNGFHGYMHTPQIPESRMPGFQVPRSLPMPGVDPGYGLRSALLEEFKSNFNGKGNKRYELRDLYDHLVEFSGDREGSLFIQAKLQTASSEEKERVFSELKANTLPLMKDVFGNYVIQKFFEYGDQLQKAYMVGRMIGHVPELSLSVYGCRVVQTALEHVLVDQKAAIVKELKDTIPKFLKDENGNHVLQKAIMSVPEDYIRFLLDAMVGQIQSLSKHRYGCRIVQKLLKHCEPQTRAVFMQEIHACAALLIADEFGNYVPQHVIEHGDPEDRDRIIDVVMTHLVSFSRQKFASNVVEKCISYGTDRICHRMLLQISACDERGESPLPLVLKDNYGNYVIQSLLDHLNDADYQTLTDMIEPDINRDRRMNMSKQAENVARKMHRFDQRYAYHNQPPPSILYPHTGTSGTPSPSLTTGGTQTPLSTTHPCPTDMAAPPTDPSRRADIKPSEHQIRIELPGKT